jgi:hypothetical protein
MGELAGIELHANKMKRENGFSHNMFWKLAVYVIVYIYSL